jgi:AraC family transcriptional regulator
MTDVDKTAADPVPAWDPRIDRAVNFIHGCHDPLLDVPRLARYAGLSQSHFHRLFRKQMGTTPARYLKDARIHQVEHLIRTTNLPLQEILLEVGVTDRSHFLRNFKRLYGMPPSIYRERIRAKRPEESIASPSTL